MLACGAAFGSIQGVISTRFRLEPFIVTLAGLQVARGLALVISNNQYINISYGEGPGLAPRANGMTASTANPPPGRGPAESAPP